MVKCHLEGRDHSAKFPDKETGYYPKLDIRYSYSVYGHPYNPNQTWKPKIAQNNTTTNINNNNNNNNNTNTNNNIIGMNTFGIDQIAKEGTLQKVV